MNILANGADINFRFDWPESARGWLFLFLIVSLVVAAFFSAMAGWVAKAGSGPKNTAIFFVVLLIACSIAVSQGRV